MADSVVRELVASPPGSFLAATNWYMSFGERAAVIGVLASLRPRLAIEIGSADGGSLRPVALHARTVHSFDLRPPPEPQPPELANVVYHVGDCHELLAPFLAATKAAGALVEYAMVDGDHSPGGVRHDLHALLSSEAVQGMILVHDVSNPDVRRGIDSIDFTSYPGVVYVDLDFVSGRLIRFGEARHQLWGALGLIAVDPGRQLRIDEAEVGLQALRPTKYRDNGAVLALVRQILLAPSHIRLAARHPSWVAATLRHRAHVYRRWPAARGVAPAVGDRAPTGLGAPSPGRAETAH